MPSHEPRSSRTAALALLLTGCTVQDVAAYLRAHPRAVAALLM
jgi:hypothetical protein